MAFKITDEDIKRAFSDEPVKKTNGFKVTDADIAKHFKQSDTKAAGAQAPAVSLDNDIKPTYKAPQQETVKLPSYIENQGLYFEPGTKSRIGYLIDSSAKGLVGGALQAGEAIWQDLSGEAGKAERAYYDYVMESAYNPEKSGQLAEYQSAKDQAAKNEKLKTDTLGYKLLESSDEDMAKATEGMGRTGQFLTGVVGSTLQNAYLIPLAVINPAASAAVMAMSAAGRSAKEQSDRGRSLDRAVARGAVDGSIEYFTELMGMDAVADLLVGQGENIVKNVFRSVVSEAGEEGLSYLAGYIADKLEKDPEAKFSIQELLLNMLAGGLSGGLLGGGSAMVGAMANTLATPEAVTELPAPENITPVNTPASTEFVRTNSQENNIDTKPVELPNPANAGISDIIGNEKPFDISKLPQVRPVQLPNPNTAGIVQQAETNEKPFDINSLPQAEKKAVPAVSRLKEYVNTLPEISSKNAENYLNKKYDDSGITAAQFIENNIDSKFIKDGKLYYIEKDGKRLPVKKSMYDYAMFLQSGAKDSNVPGKIDTDTNVGAKAVETVNERYSQHQAEKEQGRYVRQNTQFKQTMYNGFAIEKVGDNYIVWDNQTNQIAVTKPTLKGIKEALDKWENSLKNRTATVTETVEENPAVDTAGYGNAKVIGKKGNIDILDSVPDGWKRFDMTTAPVGYVGVTNNKSLFGGERKSALVAEENLNKTPLQQSVDNGNIKTESVGVDNVKENTKSRTIQQTESEIRTAAKTGMDGRGFEENRGRETRTHQSRLGAEDNRREKIGKGKLCEYFVIESDQYSQNAKEAVKEMAVFGITPDVYDGDMFVNGKPRQKKSDATVFDDGSVAVNNDAKVSGKESAGHEIVHHFLRKGNEFAVEYNKVFANNFEISSDEASVLIELIQTEYTGDLTEELPALYSGWLYSNETEGLNYYNGCFIDESAVKTAHKKFIDAVTIKSDNNKGTSSDVSNSLPENKQTKAKKEKSTPENKITDFGEKISGARKDMWKDRGLDVRDIEGMTEKEKAKFITKDNIWKKPNYEALIKDGKDKNVTYFLKTVRDALPTKPEFRTTNADLAKQVQEEYVKQMREITDRVMALETKEQIMNAFDEVLVKGGYITKDSSRLYAPWHPTEKGKYIFTEKLFNAFRNAEGTTGWRYLTDKVRKDQFGVPKDEKIPKGYGLREFENGWGVLKGNRIVQDKFATREAALSWLKENTKKAKNNRFVPPSVERVRREGADVRKGEAATGDSFMEKFGFRGGQFGEWTNQKERQMNLNFAYDAFHDLARTLGISEKDVSFGGKLAIAFGARGRGGAKAAAAHYEYTEEVINLTRMKGAGTLGHEWAHALDDFIGQKVVGSVFTKYRGRQSYEPFNKVMDAMKWREATAEELAKMNENSKNDNIRRATSWLNSVFSKTMVEKMTDSQKTKYENLKESFLNAEKGSVDKLNELHKEITNRVIPKSTRDTLMSFEYIWLQTDTNQRTSAKVPTDYIKNSRWFDKYENRSDTYYSSDEEMFARAFHTYILDKTEGVSDYLNGSAEWHVLPDLENNRVVRAYPTGTERAAINKAFDEFFDALKKDGYLTAQEYADREMISYSTDGAKVTIEGKMLIEPLKDTDSKPKEKLAKPKKAKDSNKLPESVGAAKANPKNITHLVNEYGEIKPGENPARFVSAPISTDGTDRVGKFARTAMEAEVTSDKMVAAIEKAVARGEFSHEIYRDKTAIKDATEYIEKYGYEKTLQEFYNRVNNNSGITKQDMTKAMTMYAVAVENDDIKTALKLATKINKAAVNAGQVVQSVRILKKSSPENRLYYAQKSLEAYQDEVNEKYGDKAPVLKIEDSILTALKDARTEAEIEQATADLHQAIADQLPFSWSNFWTSWRYLAMLGNPRTQVRNVLSNAVNTVATEYTAWIQSTIEKNVKGLPKTTTMEKPTRAQVAFAEKDYENIKKQLSGGGKYQKDSLSAIERLKDPFSFPTFWGKQGDEYVGWRGNVRKAGEPILKGISKWNELTNKAMENGDLAFSSRAYKRALARYLKANNINPAKITAKQLSEARTWATRQALESVFRENNRLASWMSMQERNLANSKKKGDRIAAKIIGGIMPFKGTPLNISKRAFEYTPLGVIKGLTEMKFNDDVYMPAAINDVAKGLSGTSLIVLGAALAKYGLLKGGLGNDKEDKMEKQMGEQAYSISTPWWSYTLDWSGAAMMPLFVGADIYESNSEDENWLTNIINAFANAGSPIIETSMMTGLMDSIQAASYEDKDTEKVMTFLSSAMASYAGQFVPTILGQIARAVDDTSRSSYTNVKGVLKPVAKTLQKAENKIPFLSKTNVPYMDVWGNNEKNIGGNPLSRLAYNMLSPGYISTKSNDKVEKMLMDLYDKTGDTSVLPSNYTTSKKVDGENIRFTDKQFEQYTKAYGQTAYNLVDELSEDNLYKSRSDDEKVNAIKKVYEVALKTAGTEVFGISHDNATTRRLQAVDDGIPISLIYASLVFKSDMDTNNSNGIDQTEAKAYIDKYGKDLSDAKKAALFKIYLPTAQNNPYA